MLHYHVLLFAAIDSQIRPPTIPPAVHMMNVFTCRTTQDQLVYSHGCSVSPDAWVSVVDNTVAVFESVVGLSIYQHPPLFTTIPTAEQELIGFFHVS